jgi:AcrR family transcriptional regulator
MPTSSPSAPADRTHGVPAEPVRRQTLLDRQLAGGEPDRPTPVDALRLARHLYNQGERIDMGAIADELGISRMTLNRWVGTREDLIGEVSWGIMRDSLDSAGRRTRATGGERVVEILMALAEAASSHPGAQAFLEREPELAMRVNTSFSGRVAPRFVAYLRQLLEEQYEHGLTDLGVEADELAYAIIQIVSSFFWRPFITGEPANLASLGAVLRLLLCRDHS